MTEKTVQCRICGKPYKFYMFHAGDQSACPECREEAEDSKQIKRQEERKREAWNYWEKRAATLGIPGNTTLAAYIGWLEERIGQLEESSNDQSE